MFYGILSLRGKIYSSFFQIIDCFLIKN